MIDRITIADVARLHGLQELRTCGRETYCVCPFCGDKNGKFSYNVKKDVYQCFRSSCGHKGNAISLHIELSPSVDYSGENGYKKAVKDLFSALNADSMFEAFHNKDSERLESLSEETPKASDNEISRTYKALLSELELRPEHKKDLLRRGLTETDISVYRFKSAPKDPKGVCRILRRKGYTLEGVPGFYKDDKDEWCLNISYQGYLCPVYDGEYNLLTGFQIRMDKPVKKMKYYWLTSKDKKLGTSPGAQTTYLPGKSGNIAILTEGILKATIIYALLNGEVSVLGIAGTKARNACKAYLERFHGMGYIYEAFDMDKALNPNTNIPKEIERSAGIAKEAEVIKSLIEEYSLGTSPLIWDYDENKYSKENYKGLDDFLQAMPNRKAFVSYILRKAKPYVELQKYLNI